MSLIAGVRGILEQQGDDYALVGVGGVTLRVNLSLQDLGELGLIGSNVQFWTHLVVREDDLQLYGFTTDQGLRLFQSLIEVSGVGPKVALAILSALAPEAAAAAIVAGDATALSRAPGVGKRTAERIIVDLKGKFEEEFGPNLVATGATVTDHDPAVQALLALGYSTLEARQALAVEQEDHLSTEDRVRRALQRMGR
jgi:Holliday junction DNA helicase RuvA